MASQISQLISTINKIANTPAIMKRMLLGSMDPSKLLVIVTVFGLGISFIVGLIIIGLNWRINNEQKVKLLLMEEKNLTLEKKLEAERKTRLEMEESIAPRLFEQTRFAEPLRKFVGVKMIVEALADAEASRTARQIISAVAEVGWQIVSFTRTLDDIGFMDGIEIRSTNAASSEESLSTKAADALIEQLLANKIEATHFTLSTTSKEALALDTILVRVGLKPQTFFIDKLLDEKTRERLKRSREESEKMRQGYRKYLKNKKNQDNP